MFRILEVGPQGTVETLEGATHVGPPAEGYWRWVDLSAQDDLQLEILRERFNFHPLAIEDCAHFDQRPKLEEYGDYLFIVTQGFVCEGGTVENLKIMELHTFIGSHYLVTVHNEGIDVLDFVWKRAKGDPALLRRGLDFIFYLIVDRMVDGNFPILDLVSDELETLEEDVLANPKRDSLSRIFDLKRQLVFMRKVLSPQRDVLASLNMLEHPYISEKSLHYFRDVYDHLMRINESIEANRDLLGNARETYLSTVSQRTNEIMKHLTIMSAVFLPLAFVVGFFGQNFQNLLGLGDWMQSRSMMWTMIVLCVGIPAVMILWFKQKKWI